MNEPMAKLVFGRNVKNHQRGKHAHTDTQTQTQTYRETHTHTERDTPVVQNVIIIIFPGFHLRLGTPAGACFADLRWISMAETTTLSKQDLGTAGLDFEVQFPV